MYSTSKVALHCKTFRKNLKIGPPPLSPPEGDNHVREKK